MSVNKNSPIDVVIRLFSSALSLLGLGLAVMYSLNESSSNIDFLRVWLFFSVPLIVYFLGKFLMQAIRDMKELPK